MAWKAAGCHTHELRHLQRGVLRYARSASHSNAAVTAAGFTSIVERCLRRAELTARGARPVMTDALALYDRVRFERTEPYLERPTVGMLCIRLRL